MLEIIGVGQPRTGTKSLKFALELLGFGPCYHMIEVFDRNQDISFWLEAVDGNLLLPGPFDFYRSTTDAPACYFWPQLARRHPNAKCILTVRDGESWYESFTSTVYQAMMFPNSTESKHHHDLQHMARKIIVESQFRNQVENRSQTVSRFHEHNQAVVDTINPERLLVLNIREGWEPLCHFLNVPVPELEFPRCNSRAEFQEKFQLVTH